MHKLLVFVFAIIILTCQTNMNAQVDMPAPERASAKMAGPPVIVYKTAKKYHNKVAVTLSEDKQHIVNYPDPRDVGKKSYPTKLKKGYLLDNRGINANTAFLSLTYEEYAMFGKAPKTDQLFKLIINDDPIKEMYRCGTRFDYKDFPHDLLQVIDNKFANCYKLK